MNRLIAAAVVFATASAATAGSPGVSAEQFRRALAVAQKYAPGGQLTSARAEQNNNVIGFYFWLKGTIVEVEVSGSGMNVVKVASTEDGKDKVSPDVLALIQKNAKEGVKLPEGRLLEIASGALNGTPFTDLTYSKVGDELVLTVGGQSFSAQTGQPVATPAKSGK